MAVASRVPVQIGIVLACTPLAVGLPSCKFPNNPERYGAALVASVDKAMAAGSWCVFFSSPAVNLTGGQSVPRTQGFNYHWNGQRERAGRLLSCLAVSHSSPSTTHKCRSVHLLRRERTTVNAGGFTSHNLVLPRSRIVAVVNHERIQLGRAATRQQQQFGSEDASRRLQSSSRSTDCTRIFCKPSWKETFSNFLPDFSSGLNSRPALDSSLSSQRRLNAYQSEKLEFWIIIVSTSDELLAAATLRAQLFYSYPKFAPTSFGGLDGIKARLKHEFDLQDLLKSRVKSEFERDTKMQDLNMNVKCLLAVCEESNHDELLLSSKENGISLITPPAVDSPAFSRKPLVAIGTLDIQDGTGSIASVNVNTVTFQLYRVANAQKKRISNRRQVSENGAGHRLLSSSSKRELLVKHGYIFNLCVADTARRHGVATALMKEAVQVAQQMHLQILYVHVEANNPSALALYQKLGYTIEEEEPFDVERRFQRPRRILLSFRYQ